MQANPVPCFAHTVRTNCLLAVILLMRTNAWFRVKQLCHLLRRMSPDFTS